MTRPRVEIRPRTRSLGLEGLKGRSVFDVLIDDEGGPPRLLVCFDIYAFQPQAHPENHLGWWRFDLGKGRHVLEVEFDFNRIGPDSLVARAGGTVVAPEAFWANPDYRLDPLQDCRLAGWAGDDLLYLKRTLIKIGDSRVLKDFYERHFRSEGYRPPLPFLDLLHKYKLRKLAGYFRASFKGRVLDVGCGLSLFSEIGPGWGFKVVAGDLVFGRMKQRKEAVPWIDWSVFDAARLPFRAASFDGLFAGEILEHLPDPERALAEWNRVLKPGGILIVTTPNRGRRVNRLNGEDWPFSPDHLRELSFEELNDGLLPGAGFEPLKKKGIYLELWTKSNGWWLEDHLQRRGNTPAHRRRMAFFCRLGYLFPRRALVLMTVARKPG
jgi:SAM-dependent methyltransferase